ncbi:MAG TPA: hypothetical protein VFZ34_30755, partial [Blastocatellia bacterium]|nr:hypothetical protein [Blastocatellia bacterium]
DPTPENIRLIIKRIADHIVADGQFDESDVTLQELNVIRETLIQTLISIHHQRVSYPGFNPSSGDDQQKQREREEEKKKVEPPIPPVLEKSASAQTE